MYFKRFFGLLFHKIAEYLEVSMCLIMFFIVFNMIQVLVSLISQV